MQFPVRFMPSSRLINWCAVALLALWCLGQLIRDSYWLLALLFYIPAAVLATGFLGGCLLALSRRNLRTALLYGSLAALPTFAVLFVENSFSPRDRPTTGDGRVRAVHWNVVWGKLGWSRARDRLKDLSADVYVLSEVPVEFSADDFGGYSVVRFGTMAVVARGTLGTPKRLQRAGTLKLYSVRWNSSSGPLELFVGDIDSNPLVFRHPLLVGLCSFIAQDTPDLVMGDFNSPRRSIALSALPQGYHHAYHSVGSGWSYTWPVPCPIYAIDHCIHGPRVRPIEYRLHGTTASDHRIQVFDFDIDPSSPRPTRIGAVR